MEPIRPDSDEVAARKNDVRRNEKGAAERTPRGGGARPRSNRQDGMGKRASFLPLVLIALVVLAGGWMLVQQHQTIQQLQSNLGEAEDWINRSKLSMARFEGRLSEADRELLESGSQITEKLAFLDSEMRKLWGVSNDRNRKAIEANRKATEFLEKKTDYLDKQRAEHRQLLTNQLEQLEVAEEKVQALEQRVAAVAERQQGLENTIAGHSDTVQALQGSVQTLQGTQGQLQETQSQLQGRLTTMNQRQTLSLDELRARLDAMEEQVAAAGDQSAVKHLQEQFASLKNIVDSIDASRSQLTSRLIQLEQRVQGAEG
jgi:chromosome segregation ATPase